MNALVNSAIKNKKTTLGGLALLAYVLFTILGALSGGGGFAALPLEELVQLGAETLVAFGLIAARDADKSSEDQQ